MNTPKEAIPATVTKGSKQAGDTVRQRWRWVEPCVWTERMLETLERGVKGGKWFALIDKVYDPRNLRRGFEAVWGNDGAAGSDGQRVRQFAARLEAELGELGAELQESRYQPHPVRRVYIEKPGSQEKRPLGIPAVRDRVVQTALRHVIEPIFEREFAPQSYGFRPGRGCKDALRRVDQLLRAGYSHVVDADIKGYFDSIPHEALMEQVRTWISDGRVLALVESFLKQGVLNKLRQWEPTESGTPQGAVISPLLANLYLHPLDLLMQQSGREMVRYADDFVILCRSREEAETALRAIKQWISAAGLVLHPEKTRLVDLNQDGVGFDFLGYHFRRGGKRWPRKKSVHKLKETLRAKTRRNNGQSLRSLIIEEVNPTLRGWYGYFCHSIVTGLNELDGWLRGRLRAILRKRCGGRGRSRGRDHQRWTNDYFARQGLFSLHAARMAAIQPHR
jgi:RNA-directed DNA polymerase